MATKCVGASILETSRPRWNPRPRTDTALDASRLSRARNLPERERSVLVMTFTTIGPPMKSARRWDRRRAMRVIRHRGIERRAAV
jgi:hypothetical protein